MSRMNQISWKGCCKAGLGDLCIIQIVKIHIPRSKVTAQNTDNNWEFTFDKHITGKKNSS